MVYDLGGGTFDVSILEMGDGVHRSCCPPPATTTWAATTSTSASSTSWLSEFQKENGIDLRQRQDGHAAPEGGRREGQDRAVRHDQQANINLPFITADATGPKHLDYTLTRAKFNELTARPGRSAPWARCARR